MTAVAWYKGGMNRTSDGPRRALFVIAGCTALAIGIVGIVVPVLPTTPFLLLAAACFLRGSRRAYGLLMRNRFVGAYIRDDLEHRGMTAGAKVWTLALMGTAITVTAALATDSAVVRVVLALIMVGVSAHILAIKTLR